MRFHSRHKRGTTSAGRRMNSIPEMRRRFPACFRLLISVLSFGPTYGLNIAITGSSQGIGLDAARRLIAEGHTIFHACRNQKRADVAVEEAGGGIPLVCDLADLASVRSFADTLEKEVSALDVLCLNAAVAPSTKASAPKLTKDGFDECIGTNHLGHFLLANLLHDHLRRDGGGKLVVTASSVHDPDKPGGDVSGNGGATLGDLSGLGVDLSTRDPNASTMVDGTVEYDGGKVYMDSKLCNILFFREALKRWGDGDISIRSFNPGFIPSSGLFRAPRKDNWLGATAFTFVAGLIGFAVPITVGGERLAYMALADETEVPSGSYLSGEVGSRGSCVAEGFCQSEVSKEASDDALAANLWDASAAIVGL